MTKINKSMATEKEIHELAAQFRCPNGIEGIEMGD
jgi:hypothetical protein